MAESISSISDPVCGVNFTGEVYEGLTSAGAVLEAVLRDEREVVPLIEHLASDLRIALPELPDLPVLPGHQLLVERGDLDVEIELRKEEVGGESTDDVPLTVPLDVEGSGLVVPGDPVEVEELCELALRGVGEADGVALGQSFPSRSFHTWSRAIAKTTCPFCRRSITASG